MLNELAVESTRRAVVRRGLGTCIGGGVVSELSVAIKTPGKRGTGWRRVRGPGRLCRGREQWQQPLGRLFVQLEESSRGSERW
jgi:hypothetical protein